MELRSLISDKVFNYEQLDNMMLSDSEIENYCANRHILWKQAVSIFRKKFEVLGRLYITKRYEIEQNTMVVSIYSNDNLLVYYYHDDPITGLMFCSNILESSYLYVETLMGKMRI